MYTVIGSVNTRAARVLWMLEELGLPYEHVPARPRSEAATAANPAGKVPVLIEDGTAITDSTAILTYLADRHGMLTAPAGTLARARQDSMTQFILDEFDAALWVAARHSFILPEDMRRPEVKDSLKWEFARSQAVLVARLGDQPFVTGTEITVPDIILAHCGVWSRAAGFPVTEPAYASYIERLCARPAFARAMGR